MSDELRMDLADCRSPDEIISAFLRHYPNLTIPVPIEELAEAVGIREIKGMDIDGFQGALVANPEKSSGIIIVQQATREDRRRFTIGHELGHFLIPYHGWDVRCTKADMAVQRSSDPVKHIEAEANRFAASLLMPKPYYLKHMRQLGNADLAHIMELKRLYQTSVEAAINRYAELTDDTCAFVMSKDGIVRYVRPTRDFPRLAIRRQMPLPAGSFSVDMPAMPLRKPSRWCEIDGTVWLDVPDGQRAPRLLEQAMRQSGGYQITLLFLDEIEDEAEVEQMEMEDQLTARFRR